MSHEYLLQQLSHHVFLINAVTRQLAHSSALVAVLSASPYGSFGGRLTKWITQTSHPEATMVNAWKGIDHMLYC